MKTALCKLLGIEVPIVQAGMSIYTSPELAAAVSNSGALGSLGLWQRPVEQVRNDLDRLRDLTDRPFALNHVVPDLDREAFELSLAAGPAVLAFALDDAGPLLARVHDAGAAAMQQVNTVEQAERAVDNGADVVVAQGAEAGGYAGRVSTLALVAAVAAAVAPVPVLAAGGIADGRGIAAALSLGAAGVNLGTRFLATEESPVSDRYRTTIVESRAEDWVQYEFFNVVRPNPGTLGYGTRLRARRNDFTERHQAAIAALQQDPSPYWNDVAVAITEDRLDEVLVSAGESAALVDDVLPVSALVDRLMAETLAAMTPHPTGAA